MPLLARRIDKASVWADAEEYWSEDDFPFELLAELKDGRAVGKGGLSVYECSSPKDEMIARIAAAFYVGTDQKKDPQATHFRFVHTDQLDACAILYEKTPGELKDPELNTCHYDIRGLTGPKALQLARLLGESEVVTIKQPAIIRSLTQGFRIGWHDKVHAKEGSLIAIHKKSGLEFSEEALKF